MFTQQQQPAHAAPHAPRAASRGARIRTLIEAVAAMYIVLMLTMYAVAKILQTQFSNRMEPYFTELPVGEFGPASLFWMTYAQAPMYETILGLIEAACVLLVFFRRTRPIGALMTLAVMGNVAAMNVYFDISAKFNAISLAIAALVLVLLFWPTYTRWIDSREDASVRFAFGKRAAGIGLGLKILALAIPIVAEAVVLKTIIWPLSATAEVHGKWLVEAVDGEVASAHGVAPISPGAVVMFNRMNVLAVRSGELFHLGRYVEQQAEAGLELWMYRVATADRSMLPPPGRLEARARVLATYPLGYHLSGTYDRIGEDRVALRLTDGGQPALVTLRKMPVTGTRP